MISSEPSSEQDVRCSACRRDAQTLSAEELRERANRPLSEVLVELVELELAGRVRRLPGGLYRRE